MESVLPGLVSITLQHHRFHIVVQDFLRYTAEEAERIAVTGFQRVVAHVVGELDVKHSAVPEMTARRIKKLRGTLICFLIAVSLIRWLSMSSQRSCVKFWLCTIVCLK